ncbi:MAG: PEP/pyruvate-binding domain-containing protein, partial [bacterium]
MRESNTGSGRAQGAGPGRRRTDHAECFTRIGTGEIGGKAGGLARLDTILTRGLDRNAFPEFDIEIPSFRVIATDWFELFMEKNNLYEIALSDTRDRHMANAFLRAELPPDLVDELRDLITEVHAPLAVRSSSVLEDALDEPFAGVYDTKMVPNNQFSAELRLRTLREAVKFVYASTFSRNAKSYRRAMGRSDRDEKMAVVIQEVVGLRHGDRFYPNLSGVARSYNFYALGNARPEDGVVSLALGLGKTIVDGGRTWTFCPAYPKAKPPYGSMKELLTQTQTEFWSVNMGKPPTYDPIQETEYLFEGNLAHAEEDGVLRELASTYNAESDRLTIGTGTRGPRVLNFAPLLELGDFHLNDLVKELLEICESAFGNPVEIEFAVNFSEGKPRRARFGFLQVRPMYVSRDEVEISEDELHCERAVVASEQVLGNGELNFIRDVVYVKPDVFSAKDSWLVAAELEEINREMLEAGRPYLLVVLGRLGTSDPWLGIPVKWGQ